MSKLKISELFYSVQGEGRYMGVPSVFLRTFGCNFKCDGFGMPKGEKSVERFAVDGEKFKSYKLLPLVSTGCDSYASWDTRFKHLSPVLDTNTIVDTITDLLPHGRWKNEHLVITGGEPLLGWQRAYPDLLSHDNMRGLQEITFETNGTQLLEPELITFLNEWKKHRFLHCLTFSVSPKLSISGENWEDAICPDVVQQYYNTGFTYLKFVIATKEDAEEAEQAVNEYSKRGFKGPVYLMPCGGVPELYNLNNRTVAELAMQKGWRYSDRLQVPLFKNEWGT
jgi:organic radical activating enzyme